MKKICILLIIVFSVLFHMKVDASPLIMVKAEGIVDGYVGENIASKIVELKLNDDGYYFEVEDMEEISDWFENIHEGLEAYVSNHRDDSIHASFEGTPFEEKDEMIIVNVPDGYIIDRNSEEGIGILSNTPDDDARYEIRIREPFAQYQRDSIISGFVGEQIEAQLVYISLFHTTGEASMNSHVFPVYNGLTPKVKEILKDNVIVVEYTGVPLREDDSLIHTVLPDEDLKCDRDLNVPDREDVRFDIRSGKLPEPIEEKSFEFPVTGVE